MEYMHVTFLWLAWFSGKGKFLYLMEIGLMEKLLLRTGYMELFLLHSPMSLK